MVANPTEWTESATYPTAWTVPISTFNLATEAGVNLATEDGDDLLGVST